MWKYIKALFVWIIDSSKNPANLSLTLKGLVPFLVLMGVDSEVAGGASDGITNMVIFLGQFVSITVATIGFLRKIIYSFKS